ncbi:hypothetical protein P7D31_12930 [Enterococcus dongliensis]|nr:hypothetical protein [Enterococcus dongliensis]
MRKGELHTLLWNDVDFATGEVKICRTLTTIDGVNILQNPKKNVHLLDHFKSRNVGHIEKVEIKNPTRIRSVWKCRVVAK